MLCSLTIPLFLWVVFDNCLPIAASHWMEKLISRLAQPISMANVMPTKLGGFKGVGEKGVRMEGESIGDS